MPTVAEAIEMIGDVQVRNTGTIGGAIAHADPASDAPAIALAFDGSAVLRGPGGERVVPLDGFFEGPFATGMADDEIILALRRGPVPEGARFAYRKLAHPASGYSLVAVAAVVAMSGGSVSHVRVAITGVGDVAYRARGVEAALHGSDGSPGAIAAAASQATAGIRVNSDIHADAAYRRAMAEVYTRRAIEAALGR
jgi:carbon-monoxide dehydrogenase medium subunit